MVVAIVFVGVVTFGAILASVGIAPVVDIGGISWDTSAYIAHDQERTVRYVSQQENETERSRIFWENAQRIALYLAVSGAIIATVTVVAVQRGRTMRQYNRDKMIALAYAKTYYFGEPVAIKKRDGRPALYDYARGEVVPFEAIEIEMAQTSIVPWRP